MSLIPENDKPIMSFRMNNAPPIRRLFLSQMTDDSDPEIRNETDTFRVFLRIKPNPLLNPQDNTIKIVNNSKLICKPVTSKYKKVDRVEYTFSYIFGPETTQRDIFVESVVPCIEDLINCRNSLIFAYGTTNAGKTYTVQGSITDPGLIPRTLHTIFCNVRPDRKVLYAPYMARNILKLDRDRSLAEIYFKEEILRLHNNIPKYSKITSSTNASYSEYNQFVQILEKHYVELKTTMPLCSVWISFVELYNETIYDLLEYPTQRRKPLKLSADKHDNFYVKGLKHICVQSAEDAYSIYRFGKKNLNVACTKMNETSSRSHCIFMIKLINHEQHTLSNLSICDLAGTERQAKAQNVGIRLKESGIINGSLFQLNRCLRAIRENQSRTVNQLIPYRHSNLTKLFHSAFDDRTDEKIVMIVNINPSPELYDETQQVLKMCAIASKIKNKPIITKMLRQSTRFTTYVYGNDTNMLNDDDQQYENESSDCEDDSIEGPQELQKEINRLKEQLTLKEKETNSVQFRLNELNQMYKNTQDVFRMHVESMKEEQESYERRLKLQKDYYQSKISDLIKNSNRESYSEDDLRKELLEKEMLIEELQLQVGKKNDNRNSYTSELQNEINEKNNKIAELNSLLEEGKLQFIGLADELKSSLQKLSNMSSLLQEKNEFIEDLEQDLANKQNQVDEFEERIDQLEMMQNENTIEHERILANLEKQYHECKLENSKLIEELNRTKSLLTDKNEKLDKILDEQIAIQNNTVSIEKQLTQTKDKNEELKNELNKTTQELIRTKEELDRIKVEQNEKEIEFLVLCEQNIVNQNIRQNLNEELNQNKDELNKLREELNKIKEERNGKEREIKETKRYNTRNNNNRTRTPLKQLDKENKFFLNVTPTAENIKKNKKNESAKMRTTRVIHTINPEFEDSEHDVFRSVKTEIELVDKENNIDGKKRLFSTPTTHAENLISFDSSEKGNGNVCEFLEVVKKSDMATPAQTVKALRKKRIN